MTNLKSYCSFCFILILIGLLQGQEVNLNNPLLLKANSLKLKNPDSSAFYLNKGYKDMMHKKDTVNAINFLIELGQLYSHNVNYGKSYDYYWEALLLADKSKDLVSKSKIYHGLGWLYGFYKRDDEALKYFNLSIKIRKELIKNNSKGIMLPFIGSNYFAIINLYRDIKDFDKVRVYLDSAYQIQKQLKVDPVSLYLEAEAGYLSGMDGSFNEAMSKIKKSEDYFAVNDPSYLVLIYMFYGDIYQKMNKPLESIEYYKKSLSISNKYNRHLNTDLIVYESLSNVYFNLNNKDEAYKYLKKGKELNEEIFGRKSENSKHLLEIKDLYRIEKDKQEDLIKQQHIDNLEYEEDVWILKSIILVGTIVFLILFGFLFIKHLRQKHKNEKELLKEKQKIKLQKKNEILELKNKELTESALRLMEKDEFIESIRKRLDNQKDSIDVNVIKRILRSMQGTPTSNWKEFEARFTAVNQSFYEKLKRDFPKLRQTDLKICALVKLNFQSKDMSKLLGLSLESVHTSRHRLRKKLGLNRDENLEEFIHEL